MHFVCNYPQMKMYFHSKYPRIKIQKTILANIVMQRKIEEKLVAWKKNPYRKPLVLLGCRQVGKTYSIHQFLSSNYESYLR